MQRRRLGPILTDHEAHVDPEEVCGKYQRHSFGPYLVAFSQRFPYHCSYYPLYPPAEEVNMDYERFQQYGQLPLTPDILLVPSELRYFIKVRQFNLWL